jgi:predicted nucleic acid-binding protein
LTVVVDPSVVLAVLDGADPDHAAAAAFYEALDEDLVTTPMAVAELDERVRERAGQPGSDLLWADLDSGAVLIRWWATAMAETIAIARAHPELGLAAASLLALAPVVRTTRIATFDATRFTAARTADGDPFVLLP